MRDDREEPGAWILARVIKYVPETHQYEVSQQCHAAAVAPEVAQVPEVHNRTYAYVGE